jgi:thiol:disulfide interchange protein DsbA
MSRTWKSSWAAATLLVALVVAAHAPAAERAWVAGTEYEDIEPGSGLARGEVVEFFSYACIHCFNFQPAMQRIERGLPKDARIRLVPVVLSGSWEPFARSFYAAQRLGVAERSHAAAFEYVIGTLHAKGTVADMATFYTRYGVDPAAFVALANSDAVTRQLKQDRELGVRLGLQGTPSLAVAGRYLTADVGSFAELEDLVYWLERKSGM